MKCVVHLASAHHAFDARVFHKECRTLVQSGYETHYVVPHDRCEISDGVHVHGVPASTSRWERIVQTTRVVYQKARALRADLYHLHDVDLLPFGVLLARMGVPVVYDSHEDVPSSIRDRDWLPPALRGMVSRVVEVVESALTRRLSAVVAATPTIRERFASVPVPVTTVQNFPVLDTIDQVPETIPYADRAQEVAYVGTITRARGIHQMVDAMGLVNASLNRTDVVSLVMVGHFGSDALQRETEQRAGWTQVQFQGRIPQRNVFELLRRVRAGLVLFQPVPNYVASQPLKLFEYMACGIPVVASDFPLWRDIVGSVECGLLVDPTDPYAIADAIAWILNHPEQAEAMGQRGREAVESTYRWAPEAEQLLDLYDRLLS